VQLPAAWACTGTWYAWRDAVACCCHLQPVLLPDGAAAPSLLEGTRARGLGCRASKACMCWP
jgi:hypothetical protein